MNASARDYANALAMLHVVRAGIEQHLEERQGGGMRNRTIDLLVDGLRDLAEVQQFILAELQARPIKRTLRQRLGDFFTRPHPVQLRNALEDQEP